MKKEERYWQARKVTLLGAFSNTLLGLIKFIGGYLFHSHALVADGVHSFADLITDAMVLLASKYGSLDADENHPYGHQRIETAATLFLSLLLIVAGVGIAWDSLIELVHTTYTMPNWLAIPVICLSIFCNEILFHYTLYVGKHIQSKLIIANAWHHRSDAASSLVVFIGLLGSLWGYAFLDTTAALIVALMIIKMGWDYGWQSIKELVDTAVNEELQQQIVHVIEKVDGVKKIHQLRTRFMGSDILIDVHILVSPKISVSEGHYVAQHVHRALIKQIKEIKDVVVHVDPEDDELTSPSFHLPNRHTLDEQWLKDIQRQFPEILFWDIHYLDGKISLDLICNSHFKNWQVLREKLNTTFHEQNFIKEIRLLSQQEV